MSPTDPEVVSAWSRRDEALLSMRKGTEALTRNLDTKPGTFIADVKEADAHLAHARKRIAEALESIEKAKAEMG